MDFEEHLKKYLSDEEIQKLIDSFSSKETKSIIINTNKIDEKFILEHFPLLKKHPFVKNCYLYDENIYHLGKHIFFEQGLYYIFEPCSSLVNYFLNPQKEDIVLDLCAAPGGKSSHLAILKENKGIIISNEISKERSLILSSNIERMGFSNVIVTNNTIDYFKNFKETFDKIILDAPCSGSGMFRKEIKMKEDWTYSKVLSLQKIQKELILKAYDLLKDGGEMIYSTCSFSYEEDEEVIQYLIENTNCEIVPLEESKYFYKSKANLGIHLFPFLFEGEGHYICKIKKPGQINISSPLNKKKLNLYEEIRKELNINDGYIYNFSNIYYYLPQYFDFKNLHIIRGGLKLGTQEKYGFEVDHALSHYLTNFSNQCELTIQEAKDYIEGKIILKNNKEGTILLTYLNNPLGFGKQVKNRINNKYPKGLRKANLDI